MDLAIMVKQPRLVTDTHESPQKELGAFAAACRFMNWNAAHLVAALQIASLLQYATERAQTFEPKRRAQHLDTQLL